MGHSLRRASIALSLLITLTALGAVPLGAQSANLEITAILPLTGPAASLGQSELDGLHAVEKRVNAAGGIRGRALRFMTLDSQSNPQVDVQLTSGVLAKHPNVVIDGGPATNCKSVTFLYASGPILWCISPAYYPERGSYRFSAGVDSTDGLQVSLTFLRHRNLRRIAILTATDIAGQEADAAIRMLLKMPANRELAVSGWEHFAPADISVAAQLTRLRAGNPDVLIVWVTGAAIATGLTGLRDSGWDIPVVASNAVQSYALMNQLAALIPAHVFIYSLSWPAYGVLPAGPQRDILRAYFSALAAAGGHADGNTAMTFDAATLVTSALQKLGTDASPDAIRAYVENLHGYVGASGEFDFRRGNQRGLGLEDCIIATWDHAAKNWEAVSGLAGTRMSSIVPVSGSDAGNR
jgi:branched-chain amino acid transport system substrate-binding protein